MRGLMTEELGTWRLAFQVVGAVGLLWLVLWFALVRKTDLPRAAVLADPGLTSPDGSLWSIIFSRRMLIIFVVIASINTTWQILRAWLPKILQEGRGYSETQALYFTSAWYAATDIGCLGAGALAVWLAHRKLSVHTARIVVFAACGLLSASCALTPLLPKGGWLLTVLLFAGAGAWVFFRSITRLRRISRTASRKNHRPAGVVAWVLPAQAQKLFGSLADWHHSFDLGLVLAAFLPLLAAVRYGSSGATSGRCGTARPPASPRCPVRNLLHLITLSHAV
jgi:hypothetical protein